VAGLSVISQIRNSILVLRNSGLLFLSVTCFVARHYIEEGTFFSNKRCMLSLQVRLAKQ
jgi:hypothetical protein